MLLLKINRTIHVNYSGSFLRDLLRDGLRSRNHPYLLRETPNYIKNNVFEVIIFPLSILIKCVELETICGKVAEGGSKVAWSVD